MKKILIFLSLTLGLYSCQNQEWEFDDFDYTTTYFPYQYPVRTLVLGDYSFDNTNDNNHRFVISTTMGGAYNNGADRVVEYVVDETLTNNLYTGTTKIIPLPKNYYSLSDTRIIIPKGSFNGGVTVQLTDDFFNDPLAFSTNYVLPLKIVSSTTDSVLRGKASVTTPDPRIPGQWINPPKDFTLFGIKYVNEYHGKYLLRGRDIIINSASTTIDTVVYRKQYVEQGEVVMLSTSGRKIISYSNSVRSKTQSPGKFLVTFSFDENNNCTIKETSGYVVSGTGKFIKDGDEWGSKKRDVMYLSYSITEGAKTHTVNDTLVFRDKAVTIEEFSPAIK